MTIYRAYCVWLQTLNVRCHAFTRVPRAAVCMTVIRPSATAFYCVPARLPNRVLLATNHRWSDLLYFPNFKLFLLASSADLQNQDFWTIWAQNFFARAFGARETSAFLVRSLSDWGKISRSLRSDSFGLFWNGCDGFFAMSSVFCDWNAQISILY